MSVDLRKKLERWAGLVEEMAEECFFASLDKLETPERMAMFEERSKEYAELYEFLEDETLYERMSENK